MHTAEGKTKGVVSREQQEDPNERLVTTVSENTRRLTLTRKKYYFSCYCVLTCIVAAHFVEIFFICL